MQKNKKLYQKKSQKNKSLLILLFIITLAFQLYFSFQSDYFYSNESYFHERLASTIADEKNIITYDNLSYAGKSLIPVQLFHLILAIFSLIPSIFKILPSILISTTPILVYLISFKMTNNKKASLISATLTAFLPVLHQSTLNQITPLSLFIPLSLLLYYSFSNLENPKFLKLFIILTILLPFTSPFSLLIAFSIMIYILISHSESLKLQRLQKEAGIFSFFFIILANLLLFKEAIAQDNYQIFWQATNLLGNSFSLIPQFLLSNLLVILLGSMGIFYGLNKSKTRTSLLISSFIFSIIILATLQIINIQSVLILISIGLVIMSSNTFSYALKYIKLTKISKLKSTITILALIIVLTLAIIPSISVANNLKSEEQMIDDLQWLRSKEKNTVIISPIEEGHLVTWLGFKNIADSNTLLTKDPKERIEDLNTIYLTWSESLALRLINKYDGSYLLISSKTKEKIQRETPAYVNENCFRKERETLYKIIC